MGNAVVQLSTMVAHVVALLAAQQAAIAYTTVHIFHKDASRLERVYVDPRGLEYGSLRCLSWVDQMPAASTRVAFWVQCHALFQNRKSQFSHCTINLLHVIH